MTSIANPRADALPGRSTWLRGDALPLVVIALAVLLTRSAYLGDPVADYDEQLYSFIGWRMQFGELPFVDWWDRKPFGLFALFAVAHALFGPEAVAYQTLAFAFAVAGAWLTYRLARLLADRVAATVAAVIQTVLLCAYASYSAQSEVFFLPLMLGMVLLLADREHPHFRRRALVAMLLGGLALQIKYTVLPQCAFLGLYALWVEHRRGSSLPPIVALGAIFAVLGLAPTIAVGLFYAATGGFEAFFFANFTSFFDRLPSSQGRWTNDFYIGIAPIAILVLGGIYAAFRMRRPEPFPVWVFYCAWAASVLAGILLPSTVYLYYYAAMSAPAALVAVPLLDRRAPGKGIPGVALAIGLLALLMIPQRYAESLERRAEVGRLAAAIAPHVGRDSDCLWLFDGPTVLYRLTESCVPTRFVYPDHLNNALEVRALGVDQTDEVARVLAMRPGAIVTANRPVTPQNKAATALVQDELVANYDKSVSAEMHGRTLTAWIRRD